MRKKLLIFTLPAVILATTILSTGTSNAAIVSTEGDALSSTASCDVLQITAGKNRGVIINTFNYSATNASFSSLVVSWGDSTVTTITNKDAVVGTIHRYTTDGTYKVSASLHAKSTADLDLEPINARCEQQVTFAAGTSPVVITPNASSATTTELADTGPGEILALFLVSVVAGTFSFRIYSRRREIVV